MKKLTALLLCGILAVSALSACGSKEVEERKEESKSEVKQSEEKKDDAAADDEVVEEKTYDETISFTWTNPMSCFGQDTVDDVWSPYEEYVMEKFNIEVEWWIGQNEGTWVLTGTMPDYMVHGGYNYTEVFDWASQGLIKPLPDGWEETYPNLYKQILSTGSYDMLTSFDGKCYAIPHSQAGYYDETSGGRVNTQGIFYRKDWANQVGLTDFAADGTVSPSELREYLEKVMDAGLCEMGISMCHDSWYGNFALAFGLIYWEHWFETEDGFQWFGNTEEWREMLTYLNGLYNDGLIDPEFYLDTVGTTGHSYYLAGVCAAMGNDFTSVDGWRKSFAEANPDLDPYECVDAFVMCEEDGTVHGYVQENHWTGSVFSAAMDDEKFLRLLDVLEWTASEEGMLTAMLGFEGEGWERDADGNVVCLDEEIKAGTKGIDRGVFAYATWGSGLGMNQNILPATDPVSQERENLLTSVKANSVPHVISANYTNYSSETKTAYSIPVHDKLSELIALDGDPVAAWDSYVESVKGIWEPLLNELNAAYY